MDGKKLTRISVSLTDEVRSVVEKLAAAEGRKLSNWCGYVIETRIREITLNETPAPYGSGESQDSAAAVKRAETLGREIRKRGKKRNAAPEKPDSC